jgi:uncharacterized metal-binding protein
MGETHEKIQILVATPLLTVSSVGLVVALDIGKPWALPVIAGAITGAALSIIFTPDLIDVDGDTIPEKRIRTVPVLGWFVATIYDGISLLLPHRGISHTPIGTLISIFWFLPLLILLPKFALAVIGWKIIADLFHTIPDPIVTWLKKQ